MFVTDLFVAGLFFLRVDMLHEMGIGGLLFSPLVVIMPVAFLLCLLTRQVLHQLGWRRFIWREAWFDVGLFVCYLALIFAFWSF